MTDALTLLRRNLRHALRYPSLTLATLAVPLFIMLLFVGVMGDTLGAGLGTDYVDYATPGILLMTIASGCLGTAVTVAVDKTSGLVDRFRTMPISPSALLTGHVSGSVIQTALGTALLVGVAFALGFSPAADALDWLAVIGLLTLLSVALTWVSVLIGLTARTPEGASNAPMPVLLLPFVSSAFVRPDSMPGAVRWFAENQPFTPLIETVRALLLRGELISDAWVATAWCVAVGVLAYARARTVWARAS